MSTDQQFPTPNNLGIAVYSNNAEAIGNTPLVRINRLIKTGATVLAKVESRNPAFSVKCRIGAALIADAEILLSQPVVILVLHWRLLLRQKDIQ